MVGRYPILKNVKINIGKIKMSIKNEKNQIRVIRIIPVVWVTKPHLSVTIKTLKKGENDNEKL